MLVGAGIGAGVSIETVNRIVEALGLGIRMDAEKVRRAGVQAVRVITISDKNKAPAHTHAQPVPEASHPHVPHGGHEHGKYTHHSHDHEHSRTAAEVLECLRRAKLPPKIDTLARTAFEFLAEAEARVHGTSADRVHFHEVGQDDAIADIVGAAVVLQELGIERVTSSPLNVGEGEVECAHGRFSIPAPATLELLRGLPSYSNGIHAELVTPTGAALVRACVKEFGPMPLMRPEAVGYGAGSYDIEGAPDMLRLIIGEAISASEESRTEVSEDTPTHIAVLEANVDDMNPQAFGFLVERAMATGALDVYGVPAQMKKNRPGLLITVLARPADAARLSRLLLEETTTLGVRQSFSERMVLDRECVRVDTPFGSIRVKVARHDGRLLNVAPEYEDCREAALRSGEPFKRVHEAALLAYWEKNKG
jgi:uncharacterized protein (TIGR00299 family) protein